MRNIHFVILGVSIFLSAVVIVNGMRPAEAAFGGQNYSLVLDRSGFAWRMKNGTGEVSYCIPSSDGPSCSKWAK